MKNWRNIRDSRGSPEGLRRIWRIRSRFSSVGRYIEFAINSRRLVGTLLRINTCLEILDRLIKLVVAPLFIRFPVRTRNILALLLPLSLRTHLSLSLSHTLSPSLHPFPLFQRVPNYFGRIYSASGARPSRSNSFNCSFSLSHSRAHRAASAATHLFVRFARRLKKKKYNKFIGWLKV